ncbi:MAG: ATPase [Thermoprotei archaeon]|nr:MAG: ATPase [Thermoprotei archaeon]RLE82947.1 MAG: ATPase [Thermoprotei archaeon]RLF03076.1 MAG: ATPase [Thermoprotei archaeon]
MRKGDSANGIYPKVFVMIITVVLVLVLVASFFLGIYLALGRVAPPAETTTGEVGGEGSIARAISILGISAAFGMAVIAAGIGIALAGSSAISAAAERPEIKTLGLIITALAEALAIYGLLVVILMLGKI